MKQSAKRARQSEKRRLSNKWQISRMKTHFTRVITAIKSGDVQNALAEYKIAISVADKLANKGLIHQNKASRHKSRLNKHIAELGKAA